MIVGLKRRRASKGFYELGVLENVTTKTEVIVTYDQKKPLKVRNYRKAMALVKAFNPCKRGRSYIWETDYVWTQPHLIVKICDNIKPASCRNEKCPYRFRCFTACKEIKGVSR